MGNLLKKMRRPPAGPPVEKIDKKKRDRKRSGGRLPSNVGWEGVEPIRTGSLTSLEA